MSIHASDIKENCKEDEEEERSHSHMNRFNNNLTTCVKIKRKITNLLVKITFKGIGRKN